MDINDIFLDFVKDLILYLEDNNLTKEINEELLYALKFYICDNDIEYAERYEYDKDTGYAAYWHQWMESCNNNDGLIPSIDKSWDEYYDKLEDRFQNGIKLLPKLFLNDAIVDN